MEAGGISKEKELMAMGEQEPGVWGLEGSDLPPGLKYHTMGLEFILRYMGKH
jgi:hypothetical protein